MLEAKKLPLHDRIEARNGAAGIFLVLLWSLSLAFSLDSFYTLLVRGLSLFILADLDALEEKEGRSSSSSSSGLNSSSSAEETDFLRF
jgi:hypothetical protein